MEKLFEYRVFLITASCVQLQDNKNDSDALYSLGSFALSDGLFLCLRFLFHIFPVLAFFPRTQISSLRGLIFLCVQSLGGQTGNGHVLCVYFERKYFPQKCLFDYRTELKRKPGVGGSFA